MQEYEVQDGFLQSTKIISLVDFSFVFYTLLNYRKIRSTDKLITKQALKQNFGKELKVVKMERGTIHQEKFLFRDNIQGRDSQVQET